MNEVEHTDDTIGHWDRLMACAIAWEMRLHADYIDPNQVPDDWDDDENRKVDRDEAMSWDEKFGLI